MSEVLVDLVREFGSFGAVLFMLAYYVLVHSRELKAIESVLNRLCVLVESKS